jgi:hypothetical protein
MPDGSIRTDMAAAHAYPVFGGDEYNHSHMHILGTNSAFRTDADISGSFNGGERVLRRWVPEAGADVDLSLESGDRTNWDQFEANARLFGVSSAYDENIYTTRIDRSAPSNLRREADAARIAREIERTSSTNTHMREERGQAIENDGENEEDKYSRVRRDDLNFPPLASGGPNKYTPPARRVPTRQPTVAGAPVDPAIISAQISKPESQSRPATKPQTNDENATKATTDVRKTDVLETIDEAHQNGTVKEQTTTAEPLAVENETENSSKVRSINTSVSPQRRGPSDAPTESIQDKILTAFHQFKDNEKLKYEAQRLKAKTERTHKLNDLLGVPYRRHPGTLLKSPDDEKGVADLGQRRSPFLCEGRLFDLPLLLGGQEILAVPDTGAQINAISVQTLKRLRGQFQSQWGSLDDVVNVANRSSTDAICQVTIHCRLAQASLVAQYYQSCVFHVFSKLASGVMAIIGRAFLDEAQILTTRSYLLRERVDHLQYIPRCMSIGPLKSSGLRLPVYLDSKLITAFPDTGSEIDLISRACALLHRFDIQQVQVTDKSVQFADGQIDTLSGKVRVKFDTFIEPTLSTRSTLPTKRDEPAPLLTPSRKKRKKRKTSGTTYLGVASSAPPDHHRTFYVLDSLPYDVVLSQSLLHSIDAFNLHASGFTTVTPEENKKDICTVFWHRSKEFKAEETR